MPRSRPPQRRPAVRRSSKCPDRAIELLRRCGRVGRRRRLSASRCRRERALAPGHGRVETADGELEHGLDLLPRHRELLVRAVTYGHAAVRSPASCRSQAAIWFQLANVWFTGLRSGMEAKAVRHSGEAKSPPGRERSCSPSYGWQALDSASPPRDQGTYREARRARRPPTPDDQKAREEQHRRQPNPSEAAPQTAEHVASPR